MSAKDANVSVSAVKEFEEHLENQQTSFESADLDTLKRYVSLLMEEGRNSMERLVALARYSNMANKTDYYIYFVSILGARNVLPDIGERLATIAGVEAQQRIYQGFEMPAPGSPPEEYPKLTKMIVDRMEAELPSETCKEILTWNYHKVPPEAFKEKCERLKQAKSIDEFLEDEHKRFVEELTGFMNQGRIWFEQEITPDVLDFVKANQEINTGVRHGDKIYMTKIPYAPHQYLHEKDPTLKRFYACHCTLARTAIRDGKPEISPTFCYCSTGYVKVRFDAMFEEPVELEPVETVLNGDMRCRFAIKIPDGKMK